MCQCVIYKIFSLFLFLFLFLPLLLLLLRYPHYLSTISYLLIFSSPSSPLLPFVFSSFFSLFPLLTFPNHLLPQLYPFLPRSILSLFILPPFLSPYFFCHLLLHFSSSTPLRPAAGSTPRPGEGDILEGRPYLS